MGFTAIIPAAGKGTRMGSPEIGKELLLDPMNGRPLIDFAIIAAQDAGCDKIVVAIEEGTKPLLQSYIKETFPEVVVYLSRPAVEWPDTVLQTKDHWDLHNNIMILPDTRYNTEELKHLVDLHKEDGSISFALLPGRMTEPEKFAIVGLHEFSNNPMFTVEKPPDVGWPHIAAWGILAFTETAGLHLMQTYSDRGSVMSLHGWVINNFYLSWFKDITRQGYIESY